MEIYLEIVNALATMPETNVIAFDTFGNPLAIAEIEPLTENAVSRIVTFLTAVRSEYGLKMEFIRTVNGVQFWNLIIENRVIQFVFSD